MQFSLHLVITLAALTSFFCGVKGQERRASGSLVTIDAAYCHLSRNGDDWVYLIAGNSVRTLKYGRQIFSTSLAALGCPSDLNLQAAFVKTSTAKYFFGDKFGYAVYGSRDRKIKKLKYRPWRKFIRKGGPDAIGERNGTVLVFKGCKMGIRHRWNKWTHALSDVKTIGLPCNIDAAWGETEGALVALKGDQVWRWEKDSDVATGPRPFNDTYTINDWTLKPSEETG